MIREFYAIEMWDYTDHSCHWVELDYRYDTLEEAKEELKRFEEMEEEAGNSVNFRITHSVVTVVNKTSKTDSSEKRIITI